MEHVRHRDALRLGESDREQNAVLVDPDRFAQAQGIPVPDMFHDGLHQSRTGFAETLGGELARVALEGMAKGGLDVDGRTGTPLKEVIRASTGRSGQYVGAGGTDVFDASALGRGIVLEGRGEDSLRALRGTGAAGLWWALMAIEQVKARTLEDTVRLGLGTVRLDMAGGDDRVLGSTLADSVNDGDGRDRLEGRDGGDSLFGESGLDTLLGQRGDDILRGGPGDDGLTGGSGSDRFVSALSGADSITGFTLRVDVIVLDGSGLLLRDLTWTTEPEGLLLSVAGSSILLAGHDLGDLGAIDLLI